MINSFTIILFNKGFYTLVSNLIPHSFIVEVEMAIRGDLEAAGSSFEVP